MPDRVYGTAKAAGARMVDEIQDAQFGGRAFTCEDPESHLWVFSSHDPWRKIWA